MVKKSVLVLPCVLLSALGNVQAQGSVSQPRSEVARVKSDKPIEVSLLADHLQSGLETAVVDSVLMDLDFEELHPADEIYDSWNTDYVRAYANVVLPETYNIDVSDFVMPIEGRLTSHFGYRPKYRRMHKGADIALRVGDTIVAAFDGKVRVRSFERRGFGYFLVLRHPNGLETVYGHLSGFLVEQDEMVKVGQPIALGGNTGRSTGPHLHFEFRFLGQEIDPEDIVDFNALCIKEDNYVFSKTTSEVAKQKQAASSYTNSSIKYHRIRNGETLYSISRKTGVSVDKLRKLNNIKKGAVLKVGKSLRTS
ncbi:peptidase [Bacteroidia bacterium]|nr:peptidase [Bacteroidia bacterium]